MIDPKPDSTKPAHPPLSRNIISYLGWGIVWTVLACMVVLVGADILFFKSEVYKSIITYLVFPAILAGGIFLILFGMFLEWFRRHRHTPEAYRELPIIDMNLTTHRRIGIYVIVLLSLFFAFSAVTVYQGYHFTESSYFCGQVCHQVMGPEYTTYQRSDHARVACAECHIGSGANWYLRSKVSGLRQVWAVATHSYHLPIKTPVENLRPARETCEECHWPGKFSDSVEKTIWHFSADEANSPLRYNLLLKIGGGGVAPEFGHSKGIHWHINSTVTVRYWARDHQRSDIPWVEVREGNNPAKIYKTADCPDPLPKDAEIRHMDCMDCHNRPSHKYRSPNQLIERAMASGELDRSLPYLKRLATQLFESSYTDTSTALKTINQSLKNKYASYMQGEPGVQLVERNIKLLQNLYKVNFFPEYKVDWRAYPDNIGHFEFPGCNRCHDEKHLATDGKKISNDCHQCHEILDQAEGEAAFAPPQFKLRPFQHPRNLGEIWRDHNCTECHGIKSKT